MEENKNLIKSFIEEIFNKHNLTAVDKYIAINLTDRSGKTQESFKKLLNELFSAFPDLHVNIEHILAEHNLVLVFLNFTGTHKGQYEGLPATNKRVSNRSADLYRIENNKIVEHWDVVDRLELLKEIGAITYNNYKSMK